MDGLKQVEVVFSTTAGISEILGLRGDGVLFRGQVSVDQESGKAKVSWTLIAEEIRQ